MEASGGAGGASVMANRQVIRRASMTVRVEDAREGESQLTGLVESLGGYVESSSSLGYGMPNQTVRVLTRVPVGQFGKAIESVSGLGTLLTKTTSSEDATEQVIDLQQRLNSLKRKEDRLRTVLSRQGSVKEILEASIAIEDVRTEIETMEAKRLALANLIQFSTIEVVLKQDASAYRGPVDSNWFKESWASSTTSAAETWRGAVRLGMMVVVYSPLWLSVVVVLFWLNKRATKKQPAKTGDGGQGS